MYFSMIITLTSCVSRVSSPVLVTPFNQKVRIRPCSDFKCFKTCSTIMSKLYSCVKFLCDVSKYYTIVHREPACKH